MIAGARREVKIAGVASDIVSAGTDLNAICSSSKLSIKQSGPPTAAALNRHGFGAPCKGADSQWVQVPPANWSLQPVAIGAVVEVTKTAEASGATGRLG